MGDFVCGDWGGSSPNEGQGRRGEWRESERRGPKPKKKRAKRGARKERDEVTTFSPSSSPLVKISSVQCGGVTDGWRWSGRRAMRRRAGRRARWRRSERRVMPTLGRIVAKRRAGQGG